MKNYFIEYDDIVLEYSLEKCKRKTICITIKPGGNIIVKSPLYIPNYKIFEFVNSKRKWIYNKYIEQKENNIEKSFVENSKLKLLGDNYILNIKKSNIKKTYLELTNDSIIANVPDFYNQKEIEESVENAYNKLILEFAKQKIPVEMEKISNIVGLKPKELKIRNFKRAWGNCSSKKVISMNKDLAKFDIEAIDYVCLHELCHLKYMNHSKDFWNMVKFYMPNYKEVQKQLK